MSEGYPRTTEELLKAVLEELRKIRHVLEDMRGRGRSSD